MHLNNNTTVAAAIVMSATTGLLSGLCGGFLGCWLAGSSAEIPKDLTVDSLNAKSITTRTFVAETDEEGVKCQIGAGSIVASKAVVGARVAGNVVVAKSIIASDSPTTASLEKQKIVAELAAMPDCGGVLILRNQEGANTPANGPVKEGQAIFLGYNKGGTPMAYTQDIPKGVDGRSFFVRAIPSTGEPNAQAGTAPAAGPAHDPAARPESPAGHPATIAGTDRIPPIAPSSPATPGPSTRPPRDYTPSTAMPSGDTLRR